MKASGEDVRSRVRSRIFAIALSLSGNFSKLKSAYGTMTYSGLSADPAAHIDIAVSRAGARRIHAQANARLAFLAIAATAAGDIERHGNQVADFDEFDIPPGLNHFTGNFMTQHQPSRRGCASAHHMLVAAANVGRNDLQNDAMLAFSVSQCEFRKVDGVNFDLPGPMYSTPLLLAIGSPLSCAVCGSRIPFIVALSPKSLSQEIPLNRNGVV